jgi:hypothetical protein
VLTPPDRFYKLWLPMTTFEKSRSGSRLKRSCAPLLITLLATTACTTTPEIRPEPPVAAVAPAPPPVREDERDRLLAQMQLKLLARDAANLRLQAELDEVRQRLDDAVLEIVRSKAKLGSLGSRAEAATALSESELLLKSLRRERGVSAGEIAAAEKMLGLANKEFKDGNFGGAFYLASNARTSLGLVASRVKGAAPSAAESSAESKFALPLRLQFVVRANVRDAPRTDSKVLRVADKGAAALGIAHRDRWVLVEFPDGLRGWSFHDQLGAR